MQFETALPHEALWHATSFGCLFSGKVPVTSEENPRAPLALRVRGLEVSAFAAFARSVEHVAAPDRSQDCRCPAFAPSSHALLSNSIQTETVGTDA